MLLFVLLQQWYFEKHMLVFCGFGYPRINKGEQEIVYQWVGCFFQEQNFLMSLLNSYFSLFSTLRVSLANGSTICRENSFESCSDCNDVSRRHSKRRCESRHYFWRRFLGRHSTLNHCYRRHRFVPYFPFHFDQRKFLH